MTLAGYVDAFGTIKTRHQGGEMLCMAHRLGAPTESTSAVALNTSTPEAACISRLACSMVYATEKTSLLAPLLSVAGTHIGYGRAT